MSASGTHAQGASSPVAAVAEQLRGVVQGDVGTDVPLAPFTSYRLGGPAAVLVEAADETDLVAAGRLAAAWAMPIVSLGRGSNVLVSDRGFPGVVVRLGRGFEWISVAGEGLEAGGATPLPRLANRAASRGLSGLEFAVAIPASLGGAVRMNAGAHRSALSDVLEWVRIYRLGAEAPSVVDAAGLGLRYRASGLDDADIVCAARLCLVPADRGEIAGRMRTFRDHRSATQPAEARNAGSMFKNPAPQPEAAPGAEPSPSAGRLIEEAGLKGRRVGGAEVSERHANFIVARAGATASDVHRLLALVQSAVLARTGVMLVPEVRLLGPFDGPALLGPPGAGGPS